MQVTSYPVVTACNALADIAIKFPLMTDEELERLRKYQLNCQQRNAKAEALGIDYTELDGA